MSEGIRALNEWTPTMRAAYAHKRACGRSVRGALKDIVDEFDARKYSYQNCIYWEQSDNYESYAVEARNNLERLRKRLATTFIPSRIVALNHQAERTLEALDRIEKPEEKHAPYKALHEVWIGCLKAVSEELDKLKLSQPKEGSPFANLFNLETLKKDPKARQHLSEIINEAMKEDRVAPS